MLRTDPRPLQVHTGIGDADLSLRRADPALLGPLLRDSRNGSIPVVALHCYPFVRQASWLASVHANAFVDLSLALTLAPHRGADLVLEALDLAPVSKVLVATDATKLPQAFFLAARWCRARLPVRSVVWWPPTPRRSHGPRLGPHAARGKRPPDLPHPVPTRRRPRPSLHDRRDDDVAGNRRGDVAPSWWATTIPRRNERQMPPTPSPTSALPTSTTRCSSTSSASSRRPLRRPVPGARRRGRREGGPVAAPSSSSSSPTSTPPGPGTNRPPTRRSCPCAPGTSTGRR